MIQGTSKNVDSFITDHIEQLIPSQRNFNIKQLSKEELIIKTPNDTKDKKSNDDKANEAGKLKKIPLISRNLKQPKKVTQV